MKSLTSARLNFILVFAVALSALGCARSRPGFEGDAEADAAVDTLPESTTIDVPTVDVPPRGAFCGDGNVDPGEACDDGNNASLDGCRGDCLSNETCGNSLIDFANGEVCDSTPGCSVNCRSLAQCGNNMLNEDVGELCDDGNTTRWDGCGSDCQVEDSVVLTSLAIATAASGCDLDGDNTVDNAFAGALGAGLPLLNGLLGQQGTGAPLLLSFFGVQDYTSDQDLRVGMITGADADNDPANNNSGMGTFFANASSLNSVDFPVVSLSGQINAGRLTSGPEDLTLDLGFLPLELRNGRINGMLTTTNIGGRNVPSMMQPAQLCGAIPSALLQLPLDQLLGGGGGGGLPGGGMMLPACVPGESVTLLDMMVAGGRLIIVNFVPTQLDTDLDGDGLERLELSPSGNQCQPIVTGCIDGDGTRIEGRSCIEDPRIADGFSIAVDTRAVRAQIVGIQ